MKESISLREFSRRMGVSLMAVQKAVKAGRIHLDENKKIEPESARADWEANTNPAMVRDKDITPKKNIVSAPKSKPKPKQSDEPKETEEEKAERLADFAEQKESKKASKSYNVARAVKEEYNARMARLDFEIRAGELVEVSKVRLEQFQSARLLRDTLLNLPDKISHELAAEVEPDKIHILLKKYLHEALEELYAAGKRRAEKSGEDDDE